MQVLAPANLGPHSQIAAAADGIFIPMLVVETRGRAQPRNLHDAAGQHPKKPRRPVGAGQTLSRSFCSPAVDVGAQRVLQAPHFPLCASLQVDK